MNNQRESTVSTVLEHLQALRESIPVNMELKEELKKELLQRMERMDPQLKERSPRPSSSYGGWFQEWARGWIAGSAIAGVALVWLLIGVFTGNTIQLSEQVTGAASLETALSPDGNRVAVVDEGKVLLFLAGREVGTPETIALPGDDTSEWQYPAWNPGSSSLAVTESLLGMSRIWIIDTNRGGSSRLLLESSDSRYGRMTWNPQGDELLVERTDTGKQTELIRILLTNSQTVDWGTGTNPAWSPDGQFIAYELDGNIIVSSTDGRQKATIDEGAQPFWTQRWRSEILELHFVKKDDRRLVSVVWNESDFKPDEIHDSKLPPVDQVNNYQIQASTNGKRLIWVQSDLNNKVSVFWAGMK